jgi:hypothetical protein
VAQSFWPGRRRAPRRTGPRRRSRAKQGRSDGRLVSTATTKSGLRSRSSPKEGQASRPSETESVHVGLELGHRPLSGRAAIEDWPRCRRDDSKLCALYQGAPPGGVRSIRGVQSP